MTEEKAPRFSPSSSGGKIEQFTLYHLGKRNAIMMARRLIINEFKNRNLRLLTIISKKSANVRFSPVDDNLSLSVFK